MISPSRNSRPQLNLNRNAHQPPWLVDMEAFFDLSFALAEEFEDLVARYQLQRQAARQQADHPRLRRPGRPAKKSPK